MPDLSGGIFSSFSSRRHKRTDMIISHKHKFIYIKNKKTASTSLEIALSKYCGADDVITPIIDKDEQKRSELGYRGAQNYRIPLKHYGKEDYLKAIYVGGPLTFYNHCGAGFVKRHVDARVWDDYYKFCFERNPWDKTVSKFNYRKHFKKQDLPDINEYIHREKINDYSDFNLYSIDNKVMMDEVFKYENLKESLQQIKSRIGLPEVPELPHAKKGIRKHKRDYREVLDETSREVVARYFAREIAWFGFKW
jgi:hypothetical protein